MGNPLPVNLTQECRKAEKILRAFVDPVNGGLDRVIPMSVLRQAQGLAIFSVARLGFLMSARAGSGVVIARMPDDSWSAPSALGLGGVGAGFNIGMDVTDFVIVLNSKQAVRTFMATGSLQLGGNLSVAVGPLGRAAEASGALNTSGNVAAMFSYSKSKGLYGGVSVEGTVLIDRSDANSESYGRAVTAKQILSGSTEIPSFANSLISTIEKFTLTGEVKSGMDGRTASARGYGFYDEGGYAVNSIDSLDRDLGRTDLSSDGRKQNDDSWERRSPEYAFGSRQGRSTNSPVSQRKSFLGGGNGQYSTVTDYGSESGGGAWNASSSAMDFGRNRSGSQSTNNELGSFARSGVQPRKNSAAAAYVYGNEERMTSRAITSFPTKFKSVSSSDDEDGFGSNEIRSRRNDVDRDPFHGIEHDAGRYGSSSAGRGLSSYRDKYDELDVQLDRSVERKHNDYTANLIDFDDYSNDNRTTAAHAAAPSSRRKPSGLDSLDKELQQARDSLSTDGSHERGHDRSHVPTASSGWRSDYGLPDDNFAAPPPQKRPPLHQRTSSAQRLWNRMRGNSQGSRSTFADNWDARYGNDRGGTPPVSRSGSGTPKNGYMPSSSSGTVIGREPSPLNEFRTRSRQGRTPSPNMYGSAAAAAATTSPTALASSINRNGSTTPGALFGSRGGTPLVVELQVVAMFDFEGSEENDLSFKRGDVIDILRRTESREDWWLGRNAGRVGNLPANYTKDV